MGIAELMRAIQKIHPRAGVYAGLIDGWATAWVAGLPDDLFGSDLDGGTYPNYYYTRGGYLSVSRYDDDDLAAALQTALDIITEHSVVSA